MPQVVTTEHIRAELFRQHQQKAERLLTRLLPLLTGVHEHFDEYSDCQSPLEAIFLMWWHFYERALRMTCRPLEPHVHLVQQMPVEAGGTTYRLDFAFYEGHKPWFLEEPPLLAVELDGHTYHERTRAQVQQRDARDRALQAVGVEVLHFSFAEFDQRPMAAMDAVRERLWQKLGVNS